ncbi:TPA: glycosyltransferase family 2 protein [Candidatus Scatousia excrementigallinarum]|uniref:Glycosyltransferase family 2 protein n=1 Tax=Candidatus Scatousia excrementigallinarum TaxID=2840935 RepID=A0A9D1F0S6_9BACT|nr:glycosyltransferase family 2 protein [Candidatus Scatousia excrementigallinarum]
MPISVIMPVYNTKESDLRMAIESILNQTYKDFEFIILNDGSTNNAEDVIISYRDPRIRYLKNIENLKLIKCSNILIEKACYEYIARLDSDDWCELTRLEKQVKYLDENPDVGVLGTFYKIMPGDQFYPVPYKPDDTTLWVRYCGNCISNSAVMMRKSIIEKYKVRYNNGALHAEDYKFWSDMSLHCKFANYPEVLSYYRISPDGITENNRQYQLKMVMTIVLDNIINDFANDREFTYSLLVKFIKNESVTDDEFNYMHSFLIGIVNILQKRISPPFNSWVKNYILSILEFFVREKQ